MPQLFQLPQVVALSTAGVRLPGAKLYFYQSGTSTPQNTYTDIDLSVAHENPVVADSEGAFAPIYLDPSLPHYRVKLTTADDVQIWQIDDVPSNQNTAQTFRLISTAPELILEETDASSNNQVWSLRAAAEQLTLAVLNDAEAVRSSIVEVDRTGTTVDTVNFKSTTLQHNGVSLATIATGSYTGTITGGDAGTCTVRYKIVGNIVHINMQAGNTVNSNSTALTVTGAPVAIRPTRVQIVPVGGAIDNSTNQFQDIAASMGTDGTITMYRNGSATGWTNSGGKSPVTVFDNTFSYYLD
jgi:hypothetical protein